MSSKEDLKRFTFHLKTEEHQKLKSYCASRGLTMKGLITKLLYKKIFRTPRDHVEKKEGFKPIQELLDSISKD